MKNIKRQQGISLVSAVFIITVLALLGSYMLKIGTVQHVSTALSAQGIRAHFAAVSGLEWAAKLATNTQGDHDSICANPAKVTEFQFTAGTLNGFNIKVTCDDYGGFQETNNNPYEVDFITVEASKGSGNDYVYRKISATISTGNEL